MSLSLMLFPAKKMYVKNQVKQTNEICAHYDNIPTSVLTIMCIASSYWLHNKLYQFTHDSDCQYTNSLPSHLDKYNTKLPK